MRFDEWGNVTDESGDVTLHPFGFAGGLWDRDLKLLRFGARDYEPASGRWMARDPILFHGGQSNLYAYVNNDPVNFVDPTGLACTYWERVERNFWDTNEMLWGPAAPFPVGLVTGGAVGNALGLTTFGSLGKSAAGGAFALGEASAVAGGGVAGVAAGAAEGAALGLGAAVAEAGGAAFAAAGAALSSAANFLIVGGAWEIGVGLGSLIAPVLPWGPNGQDSGCDGNCR
jgi:RHS repeat-associated protein